MLQVSSVPLTLSEGKSIHDMLHSVFGALARKSAASGGGGGGGAGAESEPITLLSSYLCNRPATYVKTVQMTIRESRMACGRNELITKL